LSPPLKPIGCTWSYLACRRGHRVLVWQPSTGSSFQECLASCRAGGWLFNSVGKPMEDAPRRCAHFSARGLHRGAACRQRGIAAGKLLGHAGMLEAVETALFRDGVRRASASDALGGSNVAAS
jgi:hypothetical protein